jgi:plastocyanin
VTSTSRNLISTGTKGAFMAALLAGLTLALAGSSDAATPRLTASVGPGFTISLKTVAGRKVTSLSPGSYAITVNDRSRIHDFRLRGPGLNKLVSGVGATGTKTLTVRLGAGRYEFYCKPHASGMHGAFTVR